MATLDSFEGSAEVFAAGSRTAYAICYGSGGVEPLFIGDWRWFQFKRREFIMRAMFLLLCGSILVPPACLAENDFSTHYLVGEWVVSGVANGQQAKGKMSVKPSAGDQCLLFRYEISVNGQPNDGTMLGGVDPKTGKLVEYGFVSNGDHWTNRYDKVLEGDALGKTTGKRTGTVGGESFEGRIDVDRTAMDRFTYKITTSEGVRADLVFEKTDGGQSD